MSATPAWRVNGTVYPKGGEYPRSMNREDGYKVVYKDGYESWSPKEVFEEAYRPSETFKDRLVIEQQELADRFQKLCLFVDSSKFTEIVKDENQRKLLLAQCEHMGEYLNILNQRIESL